MNRHLLFAGILLCLPVAVLAADAYEATVVIRDHRFEPVELHVPASQRIKLTVDNRDSSAEEFESHDLDQEKIIAGNSAGTIRFGPLNPGRYAFVGEFHEETARGVIVAE
ncbi:MAG: cupredoxin domain-containing protein [Gammaproteobacteria bacterium]|nr:cupredoxin domain-containing protein [Gammaproteobacteria bacterium]MCP5299326.1 cupredoxin domain-containing protein [Chromatiaceae bacterium]